MIVYSLFFLCVMASVYAMHLAVKKGDHILLLIVSLWCVLVIGWVIDYTQEYQLIITQSLWCLWAIQTNLLLGHTAKASRLKWWYWLWLPVPFLVPVSMFVVYAWSLVNMLASCVMLMRLLNSESFIKFQSIIFLVGYFFTEISWLAAIWGRDDIEVLPVLYAWYLMESMVLYGLTVRITKPRT